MFIPGADRIYLDHLLSAVREIWWFISALRYEHLGDAVLGLSVTSLLMKMYPGLRVGPSTVSAIG